MLDEEDRGIAGPVHGVVDGALNGSKELVWMDYMLSTAGTNCGMCDILWQLDHN
jgi:hypothetical protein